MSRLLSALFVSLLALWNTSAWAEEDTIQRIQKEGVLRVGVAESVPIQYPNPQTGVWEGFNIDMANELAEILGVKLEIVDAGWNTLIPGLLAGKYDVTIADLYATAKRAITVDFTDVYLINGSAVMVRADSTFQTLDDLEGEGITIAVIPGTAEQSWLPKVFPKAELKKIATENLSALFQEVSDGRVDATASDVYNLSYYISKNPTAKLRLIGAENGGVLNRAGVAYAVRPGDQHFLNFLNTFIAERQRSGQLDRMKEEWYSRSAP